MIDRRAFLRRLGFGTVGAAAAAIGVFDVERLLWVPGEKTILLPAPAALNTLFNPDWITREALRILKEQLTIAEYVDREYFDGPAWAEGRRIAIRKPARFR